MEQVCNLYIIILENSLFSTKITAEKSQADSNFDIVILEELHQFRPEGNCSAHRSARSMEGHIPKKFLGLGSALALTYIDDLHMICIEGWLFSSTKTTRLVILLL